MAVAVDGSMLGMRKEKGAPGQGNAPRPRRLPGGVVGNDFAVRCSRNTSLRTVCYGRMPEAGKVSLKGDVVAEAEHCLRLRPDLQRCVHRRRRTGQLELLRESLSRRDPGAGLLARLAASERGAGRRLRGGIAGGVAPVRETPGNPEGRGGRHRQGHPRAAARLAKKHPRRKPITRVLNFFKKQQHRMRYAEVHARGMPIGSGAVESSNKVLIKTRMKGAGMRWSENGTGQPILTKTVPCGSQAASMQHGGKSPAHWSRRSSNSEAGSDTTS